MVKSSKKTLPDKPHKDFPLFPHQNGQWAKKVKGKLHYFGLWEDPDGSLEKWLDQKDDLLAGRVPRAKAAAGEPTLADLVDRFLTTKKAMVESGELTARSFADYFAVCESLCRAFGKTRLLTDIVPSDFEGLRKGWAERWGPVKLGNEINRARSVFNYGLASGLLSRPMLYGEGFKRPSKKTLRLERAKKGVRMFQAHELRTLIDAAAQPLRAMILLGVNGGMGNSDIGNLPLQALDLDGGWCNFPRPKTGIDRRIPLWPETVAALRSWIELRPQAKDTNNAGLVFITKYGQPWAKATKDNPVSKEMRKLLDAKEINGHRNFYALRHTFETVGGAAKDQVAVDAIMGHADDSMAAVYREGVDDNRLRAVVDHVRSWLFLGEPTEPTKGKRRRSTSSLKTE